MAQSRPRTQEDFIIAGNSSRLRFALDLVLTLFFWLYTFLVVFYFATSLFAIENELSRLLHTTFNTTNRDAILLLAIGTGLFIIFYLALHTNRLYNKKRFGTKKRRVYPADVTLTELTGLGLMKEQEILRLQEEDYVVFEQNPIISLKKEKELE